METSKGYAQMDRKQVEAVERMATLFATWVLDEVAAGNFDSYAEALDAGLRDMADRWPMFAAIARAAVEPREAVEK
jgi:hypothetical protein